MAWPNQDIKSKIIELTPGGVVIDADRTWPEIETPCDKAPAGECEFSIFDPEVCIWCGGKTA